MTPVKSDGSTPAAVAGAGNTGKFTLAASSVYYYNINCGDAPFTSVQLTGYDTGLIITGATIQDANHDGADVTDFSATAGEWPTEVPPNSYASVEGTGWSFTAGTCTVAAAGTGVGGSLIHIAETGAGRMRLKVATGGTGGVLRVSVGAKT